MWNDLGQNPTIVKLHETIWRFNRVVLKTLLTKCVDASEGFVWQRSEAQV